MLGDIRTLPRIPRIPFSIG